MYYEHYLHGFWATHVQHVSPVTFCESAPQTEECWSLLGDDQRHPDLACRHALMQSCARTEDWIMLPEDGWIIPENRRFLAQETVFTFLADRFFRAARRAETTADAPPPDLLWNDIIDDCQALMQQRKIDPALLPGNLHYELIRPIASISTIYRRDSKIDRAESLQRAYLCLCETASRYYPGNADVCLAASEAQLQAWKNASRQGHMDEAILALRASLREAEIALDVAPDSERARFQVADRIKRLARAESR